MTWGKYRRLLAVLAIPLIGLGLIFSTVVVEPPFHASIICQPGFVGDENCRQTDGIGKEFDERLRKEYAAWFDIHTIPHEENSFPRTSVSGSQRMVTGAQILEVSPYVGTADVPNSPTHELRALTGKRIDLLLGVNNDEYRSLNPLGCNQLNFERESGTYVADLCGVPSGVVSIKFALTERDTHKLEQLRTAVDKEIADNRSNLMIHYALGVSIFPILFLMLSGIILAIKRASDYVSAG